MFALTGRTETLSLAPEDHCWLPFCRHILWLLPVVRQYFLKHLFFCFLQLSRIWRKRSPGGRASSMRTWGWRTERTMRSHWHRRQSQCSKHHQRKSQNGPRKRVSCIKYVGREQLQGLCLVLYIYYHVFCHSEEHLWRHLGGMSHFRWKCIQSLRSQSLQISWTLSDIFLFFRSGSSPLYTFLIIFARVN